MKPKRTLRWEDLKPILDSMDTALAYFRQIESVNWTMEGVHGQLVVAKGFVHINWCEPGSALLLPTGTKHSDEGSYRRFRLGTYTILERLAAPAYPTKEYIHVS